MTPPLVHIDDPALDAVRASAQPAWAYDVDRQQIAWANDAGLALWGASDLDALSAEHLGAWMAPEAWRQIHAYFLAVRDGARIEEQLTIYPQGEPVTLLCRCSGVRLGCGQIAVLVEGRVRTIETSTLRAVEALKTTEFLVSLIDFEGNALFENPRALAAHGFTRPSAITRHAFLTRFQDEEQANEVWSQLLIDESFEGELEVKTRDGTRWHAICCATTTDPVTGVRVVLVEERDVTARRKLDDRVRVHDRMASIGGLAGGLAHEINNPLAYATMNLELLEEFAAEGFEDVDRDELATILADIREGVARIRSTVADLAELARVDTGEAVPADLQAILETAITMTAAQVKHQAAVVRDFGKIPWIQARRARLSDALLHLLLYAARRVEHDPGTQHHIKVTTRASEDGERVIVEIADTSTAMPGDLDKLFEPFVAPMPGGGAPGHQLSRARHSVAEHGGEIRARPNADGGLTFHVELVAADHEVLETPAQAPRQVHGARRVLVVDDEPGIRRAIARLLGEHDVDTTSSGAEALEHHDVTAYDIIFCDMMMPVMDGMAFYQAVAERFAGHEKKIVFITAGAFTPRTASFLEHVPNPTVPKPFSRDVLRGIVESL
ncbi:MAG: response regulator [Deltaproteobacteria bacterium]|jgi:signal transduction histidine kinase